MYQPPITFNQIINPGEWADDVLLKGITDLGIKVDKEELLKALKYDRDQYDKGYEDGYNRCKATRDSGNVERESTPEIERISDWSPTTEILYRCRNCGQSLRILGRFENFCHNCGVKLKWESLATHCSSDFAYHYHCARNPDAQYELLKQLDPHTGDFKSTDAINNKESNN